VNTFKQIITSLANRQDRSTSGVGFYGFLLLSVIVLFAHLVSPVLFWPAAFIAPLAPLLYCAIVVLAIVQVFIKPYRLIFIVVVIVAGLPIVHKTYQYNNNSQTTTASFRVMSYNVSFFSVPTVFSEQYRSPDYNVGVASTLDWILQNNADIVCLQEFFGDEESTIFNTVKALTASSEYQHHFVYKDQVKNRTRRGLIILSKFPIINRGTVFMSENYYNGAIYVDVKTQQGTVRVINAHLESMRLSSQKGIFDKLRAYRRGAVTHARQVNQLMAFMNGSQTPAILCGDLNETPYSYVYHRLSKNLRNAFEEEGNGFGFTYQGNFLDFLRIDHHFSASVLNVEDHTTHDIVSFSKHLPIEARYSFK
jgi:endonuclease/exonuclease/phosphatase family metal-dependent hydrolase